MSNVPVYMYDGAQTAVSEDGEHRLVRGDIIVLRKRVTDSLSRYVLESHHIDGFQHPPVWLLSDSSVLPQVGSAKKFTIKDSGKREEYASGMRRDTQDGKPRFSLLRPKGVPFAEQMLTRLAEHMTKGIAKYGERNWELANSQEELDRFEDSAERHLNQWMSGDRDEDHAAAAMFNILAAETTRYKLTTKGN